MLLMLARSLMLSLAISGCKLYFLLHFSLL